MNKNDWYSDKVNEIKLKLTTLEIFDQLFIDQGLKLSTAHSLFEKSKFYVCETGKLSSELILSYSEYNTSFSGKIGDADFAYIDSNPTTDRKTGKVSLIYFSGIFFYINIPKSLISNTIVIIPSLFKKLFGTSIASLFLKFNRARGFFINTGHTEFDKNFAVYTNDKNNAKEVLGPDILESILTFKKVIKKPFRISLLYNYFCIAIDEKNYLKTKKVPDRLFPTRNIECRFRKTVEINSAQIQELSHIVDLSKNIIKTISMNPNISDSLGDEFGDYVQKEFLEKELPKMFSLKSKIRYYLLIAGAILTIAIGIYSIAFEVRKLFNIVGH